MRLAQPATNLKRDNPTLGAPASSPASEYPAYNVVELVEVVPGGLERYRPQLQYLLLDEGRFEEAELAGLRNLAGNPRAINVSLV